MVRECRPPAREPTRSWLARRSTMATSTPASASSPASISPVGPPPAITTACSLMIALSSVAEIPARPGSHTAPNVGQSVPMTGPRSVIAREAAAAEREQRVTALELFFDLVFVFAITQVTGFIYHDPTWLRLLEALAILMVL